MITSDGLGSDDRRLDGETAGEVFEAALSASRIAMVLADARRPDHPIVFANDAFLDLTGYPRDAILGRNCRFLQGPDTDRAVIGAVAADLAAGRDVACDLLNYRRDGGAFWNAMSISPVRGPGGQVTHFMGSCQDVTAQKRDGAERDRTLAQKTALLHEVDHRVKNNLQLISSLLLLQSRRLEEGTGRTALRGMLERVSAIATVHRRLFQSDDLERFDLADFVRDLVADLMAATGRDDIGVDLDLAQVAVPTAQAAPIALVVNELICNALKHAFPPGRGGRLTVSIRRLEDAFQIVVGDDGIGLPPGQDPGFGQTIIQLLCRQLQAHCVVENAQPGVLTFVNIPDRYIA